MSKHLPLVVIVGPTASGKTALATDLARRFGGEIICADSRTVYKGMDIGTAKPTPEERSLVPHWGLDLVEPDQKFNASDFKKYAVQKISEIRRRGKLPFLVGGTGLYIDAVIFDYQFGPKADPVLRSMLEGLNLKELHEYCHDHKVTLPENMLNKRYVIRQIEREGSVTTRKKVPDNSTIIVGIATDKEILLSKIKMRAEYIFNKNIVDETTSLARYWGWENEAMTGSIYPIIKRYVEREVSFEQAKSQFVTSDWHLAKRQITWLRRNSYIKWLAYDEAVSYIESKLV